MWWQNWIISTWDESLSAIVERAITSNEIKQRLLKHIRNFKNILQDALTEEDVLQIVIEKAWKNRDKYETDTNILNWLLIITKNTCINIYRKNKWIQIIDVSAYTSDLWENAYESLDFHEPYGWNQLLQRAVWTLSDRQQTVFDMYYNQWMSYEEIWEELGINPITLRTRSFYAKSDLRNILSYSWWNLGVIWWSLWVEPIYKKKKVTWWVWGSSQLHINNEKTYHLIDQPYIYSFYQVIAWKEEFDYAVISNLYDFIEYILSISTKIDTSTDLFGFINQLIQRKNAQEYGNIFAAIKAIHPQYRIDQINASLLVE